MHRKIAVLFFAWVALGLAQTTLTNDSIVKMVKAGLGDDVIIATVRAQPGQYATYPDGLIALKGAGVSDKVIAAMVERNAANGPAAQASDAPSVVYIYRNRLSSGPAPNSPSVFCDDQEVARIQNGRYFSMHLATGKHSFKSTDEKSIIDIDVKPGQKYFIKGEVVPVKLKPRGKLTRMSLEQGDSEARSLKPIDAGMVKTSKLVSLDPIQ